MWRKPVGLGAMRTRTTHALPIVGTAVEFGAHVSVSGGIDTAIDRIEAIGGDCVQVFTQSPRMWRPTDHKPEAIARFRERRQEARIGGVVCHALYLCNLAAPDDDDLREVDRDDARRRSTPRTAIDADAVIFHVGSHLGAGFEAGLDRTAAGARADPGRAATATRGC